MSVFMSVLTAVMGYLLGGINFGIIVSKLMFHDDVRGHGSGNAGMTNVLRTFGKLPAAVTLVGDIGKGVLAVVLGRLLLGSFTVLDPAYGAYIAGLAAILGHLFPVYFRFKGGKGVSVSAGVVLAVQPVLFVPVAVTFLVVFLCSKIVSLSSILAAVALPVSALIFCLCTHQAFWPLLAFAVIVAGLVIYMHRSNIVRLKNGTEYKFGQKKK